MAQPTKLVATDGKIRILIPGGALAFFSSQSYSEMALEHSQPPVQSTRENEHYSLNVFMAELYPYTSHMCS
jgi:hypothetical protein